MERSRAAQLLEPGPEAARGVRLGRPQSNQKGEQAVSGLLSRVLLTLRAAQRDEVGVSVKMSLDLARLSNAGIGSADHAVSRGVHSRAEQQPSSRIFTDDITRSVLVRGSAERRSSRVCGYGASFSRSSETTTSDQRDENGPPSRTRCATRSLITRIRPAPNARNSR